MVMRKPGGPGVRFGRYLIRRRLGRGGMGEVFVADQLGPLGPVRPVALKRLLPVLVDDPEVAQLFLEEIGIAAQLNHPNIATTYDFGEVDGDYFIAMELVEGLPLNRVLERIGPLPVPAALAITARVAAALEYAHRQRPGGSPVVHQDVSPHNVMVSRQGTVKLLDFGIARAEAAARGGRDRVRGKVAYAAPEQLRGAPPDRRFDLWALGVLLYECLTGTRPFPEEDLAASLRAAEAKAFAPLSEKRPEAAPVEELMTRALEPDPSLRWQGAGAIEAACTRLGERFGMSGPADLGLLVDRAGGVPEQDQLSEVSGTGVPALDADALAALRAMEPSGETLEDSAAATKTVTAPPPSRSNARRPLRNLQMGLLLLLLAAGGTGAWLWRTLPPAEIAARRIEPAPPVDPAPPAPAKDVAPAPIMEDVEGAPPPPPPLVEVAPPPAKKKSTGRRRRRARSPRSPRPAPLTAPPPAPPAAVSSGFGKLSVRTDPTWAKLLLDEKPIGRTILYGRPFDPGPHRLKLIPGDGRFEALEAEIQIRPGVTTNVFANFETRKVRVVER